MAGKFKIGIKFQVDPQQFNRLMKKLADLEPKSARKALRQGVNEVSKLVLNEAKARVPKRTGQLKKALGRKVKSFRGGKGVYAVIKPRSGQWVNAKAGVTGVRSRFTKAGKKQVFVKKWRIEFGGRPVDPVKYAHLVEYGRREVIPKKKKILADRAGGVVYGRRVRSMAPHPFLRPAWDRYRSQAPGIIYQFVSKAMLAAWLKR